LKNILSLLQQLETLRQNLNQLQKLDNIQKDKILILWLLGLNQLHFQKLHKQNLKLLKQNLHQELDNLLKVKVLILWLHDPNLEL
jgi:hypothetical protein